MRRRIPFAILAASLLGLTAATPADTPKGCDLVAALAAPGTEALRGIRLESDAAGRIDVTYRGKASALTQATECEFRGPTDMFEVQCRWDHALDLAAAQREHARLLTALGPCFPGGLTRRESTSSVEELRVSELFEGEVELLDGTAVTGELLIYSYLGQGEPNLHQVSLSIGR